MVRSGSSTLVFVFCGAVLLFLLFAASSSTARPDPTAFPISSQSLPQVVEEESDSKVVVGMEERCDEEGVRDEDECLLMRRTLVAHIDYIYTQNHKH